MGLQFTEEEVHKAVTGLASNRASGPDGLSNEFIKAYWEEVKEEIMLIMTHFYHGNLDLQPFNKANVIMLPKKDEAITV